MYSLWLMEQIIDLGLCALTIHSNLSAPSYCIMLYFRFNEVSVFFSDYIGALFIVGHHFDIKTRAHRAHTPRAMELYYIPNASF